MDNRFQPGDFLFFQLESGFALLRLLAVEESKVGPIWHLMSYHDLFPEVDMIELAVSQPHRLSIAIPHVVLSDRAFESTQVAEIGHSPVTETEHDLISAWRSAPDREVSDLSIRLLTGLR